MKNDKIYDGGTLPEIEIKPDKFYIELFREYQEKQTLGRFDVFFNDKIIFQCCSLELAWRENQRNISCIPEGKYALKKCNESPSFKYVHFDILDVPNRSSVKVHVANFVRQLRGCVAVGVRHVDIDKDGLKDVIQSTVTLKKLVEILPDKFELIIKKDEEI